MAEPLQINPNPMIRAITCLARASTFLQRKWRVAGHVRHVDVRQPANRLTGGRHFSRHAPRDNRGVQCDWHTERERLVPWEA